MALHVALNHRTTYRYDRLVTLGPQIVRLRPAPHTRTPILSYSMRVQPETHFINWQQDPHNNVLARLVFPEKTDVFEVVVDLVADLAVINPFDFFLTPDAEHIPFDYSDALCDDLQPYLACELAGPRLQAWLDSVTRERRPSVDFLVDLNQRLQHDIDYIIRLEPGVQSCEETLTLGRGSCRDSAWLLVQILRHLGLAARFVSGYLIQLTADQEALDGPSGTAVDFTDLHAWTEVYLPGAGWVGLDPTSGLLAGEGHIPLASTPNFQSAAPITGLVDEAEVEFEFNMSVTRVRETPRVTLPYSDAQWQAIVDLGRKVDEDLNAQDVRLTMGGEPTFVSRDFVDRAEWNTAAVGPTKRPRAEDLVRRLQARFAPHGLLHYGQGKWYPGESLPRWAISLYWRRDGQPLWQDPTRIAAEDAGANAEQAHAFIRTLAEALEVDPDCALPAYEDPWHYLHREHRLPEGVDPFDADLDDPEERARLARVFERGLGESVGQVLPLRRWGGGEGRRWISERWPLRRSRLTLVPGDSPLGYRLPLGSLPGAPVWDAAQIVAQDPFEATDPLEAEDAPTEKRAPVLDHNVAIRTALAVEPREGVLHVFLPPLERAADFVHLVGAIERTAATLECPVRIEGYPPPYHADLQVIKVTPDPGVVEVNIHPASSWDEMVGTTVGLYDDAFQSRLITEKFMLDGQHSGTGGGNHIVVGGATPADSPFLRRPDLLRSLVNYWQHHPSLSYLFSGLFIGPTSQAPRIDEARQDLLYELELAFQQIPQPGGECPPWLVDRIFRNLLVDVTGNTHRTEICIDKLYSPDSPSGRLGLVEFRSFEMPPHERMSLAQQLLIRALIARFWATPYARPLRQWGTHLHDKFMLPHYVWRDFVEVLRETRDAGYDLSPDWFRPHFEFRFPVHGTFQFEDVHVELRRALEPWYVMGEEGAIGGTVRYVDSSLERLQVKVSHHQHERHVIACNRCPLPLQPTGVTGESVAGVRYRAWQPAASLQPTIPVSAPLIVDLVDTWTGRALAGCTYHVAHPGGRNFETFPVNANAAESRRKTRFWAYGHTPGPIALRSVPQQPNYPVTLDLRWATSTP